MSYDIAERERRARRRATEAAKRELAAFVEQTKNDVARLVESLSGSFFAEDVPAFAAFAAALEARQAATLAALEATVQQATEEAISEEEELERSDRQNYLVDLGFSGDAAYYFAELLIDARPEKNIRTFFSPTDLERAIRGGMPREYVEAVFISDSGLIYIQVG